MRNSNIKEEFLACVMSNYSDAVADRRFHLAIEDSEAYKIYWSGAVLKTTQQWIDEERKLKGVNLEDMIKHNPHSKAKTLQVT